MKHLVFLFILYVTSVNSAEPSASYSASIASVGWQLSNAAYCKDGPIEAWSCSNCKASGLFLTNISALSYQGQRGFVGYSPQENAIYVSFMGSHDLQQWIDNIDAVKSKYPHCSSCEVHTGFYKSYLKLADDIRKDVKALKSKYSSSKLRIIGHSLGAACAVHCAADLYVELNLTPEYVYTYGQPRVGESHFSTWYDSKIRNHFRITHGRDPVPHLPLESMGFHHTALEVFYKGDPPSYKICNGSGEDDSCSNQYDVDLNINAHLTYMGGNCCCSGGDQFDEMTTQKV